MSAHPIRELTVATSQGPARVVMTGRPERGDVVLGHGAGRGVDTPDLQGLRALADDGWRVVLVDQPWVVAGRKIAVRPAKLDEAWGEIIARLQTEQELGRVRLIVGGRSAGARVACRSAVSLDADAVLALAFPLIPPGKRNVPEKWRTAEAQAVLDAEIPLLVVQGTSDAFGKPDELAAHLPQAQVTPVRGPHAFTSSPDDVVAAVRTFLAHLVTSTREADDAGNVTHQG